VKYAELLKTGETIGVISPSHIAREADYLQIVKTIESMGFLVKLGGNIFKN
jgi:muramoyltetrapeptide carboxypeptidase LdcA involved in peptidoglycan recycling